MAGNGLVEESYICKLLEGGSLDTFKESGLRDEMFLTCKDQIQFIQKHEAEYKQLPDKMIFLQKFKDFQMLEVTESMDYLADRIKEQFLYTKLVPIVQEGGNLLREDSLKAYDYLRAALETLQKDNPVSKNREGVDIISSAKDRLSSYCTNEENPHVSWHNGFVAKIYDEMYPLTLPYMPNQLRENVGNPYKPYKIPCGTAIAHASSQILWFTKGSLLDEKGEEKSSTYSDPVGNVVNVKVEKNKVTKNDRRLDSYTLNYFRGVDDGTDTIDLGIKLNVIEQTRAWFKVPVSDGSEKKLQGRAGVINYFYNDLDEFEWLKGKVNEVAMQ